MLSSRDPIMVADEEFRCLKSQLACPGEFNKDDNLPRTYARFMGNQLTRQERFRSHLWQNRNSTRAQDSFGRVLVASPSLAESLLQCSSENRTMPYCSILGFNEEHFEEKWQFDWFIRASPAAEKATVFTWHHLLVAQSFAPQLRSVTFDQEDMDVMNNPNVPFNAKLRKFKITEPNDALLTIICLNGYQMESLVLEDEHESDVTVCDSLSDIRIPMMPRLKRLQLTIRAGYEPIRIGSHFERVIPWSQLTTFSVKFYLNTLRDIYQCELLLDLLGQMAQLRQLSIVLYYSSLGIGNVESLYEFYTFMIGKTSLIQEFTNLEIFSLYAIFDPSYQHLDEVMQIYPDYRFFLDQFSPKFGSKLRTLILHLPCSLVSTHHCLAIDFSRGFRHLETLVLNCQALLRPQPYSHLEGFINFQDGGQMQSLTIRQLTIENLQDYYPTFLYQIPDIFPNVVELIISSTDYWLELARFTDQDLMQIIDRLPHLHTLRITDDLPKAIGLYGSIDLMCKRAMMIKPRHPMQFRIPLDAEFMFVYGQLPDAVTAELPWIKAAKWIQIY